MYYPNDFESRVGFNRIREEIMNYANCSVAKELVGAIEMCTDFDDVQYELERTHQMRNCVMMEGAFSSTQFRDTRFMQRAKIEGNFLLESEILSLGKSLESVMMVTRFLMDQPEEKYHHLLDMASEVDLHEDVLAGVRRLVDEYGRMRDNATPQLSEIRRELHQKSARIGVVMQRILKQAQEEGYTPSESSINIRDGRAVIPVDAGHKRKISGFVHSESATGKTAYIEPVEVVELNNQLRELEMAEKREVVRILTAFTNWVRPIVDDIIATGDFVGMIDFLVAKAKYAIRTGSTLPILEEKPEIYLRGARHPLLEEHLKREGREIVPLDLRLDGREHILLISGPNAGGKSICLKCVGLLQYMLQCGLLVPVKENSQMSVFQDIMVDIGDQQSLDNDLSTYSSHLNNMKYFLRRASSQSLILIDEFGGGTEPNIGGAIAEAILEELRQRKTFGVITTHYANLKYYGTAAVGVSNGAMSFDLQKIAPLFRLEQGRAGSSFALEIARKIGLSEAILQTAQEKIGVDQVHIEKQLRDAARDKRYWENKREKIRQVERGVDKTIEQYEQELKSLKEKRQEIVQKAREEASQILAQANRQIEKTIREIKESQAAKEATRAAREGLNSLRDQIATEEAHSSDEITRKMEQLRRKKEQKAQRAAQRKENAANTPIKPLEAKEPKKIEVGSKVKMQGQSVVGEVVTISGQNAQVEFGSMTTRVSLKKLILATADEIRKGVASRQAPSTLTTVKGSGYDTLSKRANFDDKIDLRGMRGGDGVELVRQFIDEALMFGIKQVRILHGKGTGLLKQHIREYLSSEINVLSFKDEHEEMGGAGITVVELG
ncbi:MAG: Smr/MutS family protein [Rikenellaceae bacterium]